MRVRDLKKVWSNSHCWLSVIALVFTAIVCGSGCSNAPKYDREADVSIKHVSDSTSDYDSDDVSSEELDFNDYHKEFEQWYQVDSTCDEADELDYLYDMTALLSDDSGSNGLKSDESYFVYEGDQLIVFDFSVRLTKVLFKISNCTDFDAAQVELEFEVENDLGEFIESKSVIKFLPACSVYCGSFDLPDNCSASRFRLKRLSATSSYHSVSAPVSFEDNSAKVKLIGQNTIECLEDCEIILIDAYGMIREQLSCKKGAQYATVFGLTCYKEIM